MNVVSLVSARRSLYVLPERAESLQLTPVFVENVARIEELHSLVSFVLELAPLIVLGESLDHLIVLFVHVACLFKYLH